MSKMIKEMQTIEQRPGGLYRRFRKDEDGSLLYFGLLMFILILWFGGMAVDLMRYEVTRAKLQGSMDRATLAAADLDQTLPPAEVVVDYMEKDNTAQFLDGEPEVTEGINFRVVHIDASVTMPLFFYDMPRIFSNPFSAGMSSLTVTGASTAEERVTDVEVSLILDVSSSMNSDDRITNLRPAARDFVTAVLANNTNAPNGLITISMVPYSAVVNPGTDIAAYLDANSGIDRTHTYSSCLLFDDSIFTTTALNLSGGYDHVGHFDSGHGDGPEDFDEIETPWCFTGDDNAIVPATTDEDALHDAIDALEPFGNTAIDMGVKWGVGLLDPSTQGLITSLAGASGTGVPAIADGRPQAHDQDDILKVLVLMTDGQNTYEWDLEDRFKTELSHVWFELDYVGQPLEDVPTDQFSIQVSGQNTPTVYTDDEFYWNRAGRNTRMQSYPRGFSSRTEYATARALEPSRTGFGLGVSFSDSVYQASWQDLFAINVYDRVNNNYMSRATNHNELDYSAGVSWTSNHSGSSYQIYLPDYIDTDSAIDYDVVNGSEADDRLSDICQAARDQGIVIYTVAFEAPSAGQDALLDCASSASHYYDVSGTDISSAFSAIASDIRALKLTQ